MTDQLNTLTEYIRDELGFEGELSPQADLLDEQILDSFSIVELAVFVQDSFGVDLEPDDLTRENFTSLDTIMALIHERTG